PGRTHPAAAPRRRPRPQTEPRGPQRRARGPGRRDHRARSHRRDRRVRRDRDRDLRLGRGDPGAPIVSTPPRAEPERLATTARSLRKELGVRVTLYADALAQSLADDLGLVAWDREQLIGGLQQRL